MFYYYRGGVGLEGDSPRIVAHHRPCRHKAASEKAADLDRAVAQAQSADEKDIPQTLSTIQKLLAQEGLPLRAKRRAQSAVADLQTRYKAWEKSQRSGDPKLDLSSIADNLIAQATDHAGRVKPIVSEIQGPRLNDQVLGIIDSIRKAAFPPTASCSPASPTAK